MIGMAFRRVPALFASLTGALFLAGCPSPNPPTPPVDTGSESPVATSTPSPIDEIPTAKPDAEAGTKTLFVDAELVECEGEGPMTCMRIRESASAEWELLYSGIDGFEHQPGTSYELLVKVEDVADPPADASSRRLVLVKIVSEKKTDGETP